MTQEQLQHAAEVLLGTKALTGGDEPKFLPKIYIVNGKCSLFLNAARREAYGTEYPIVVMSIEQAWEIHTGLPADTLKREEVAWEFDTNGATFDGRLYCDNYAVLAGGVLNPVIKLMSNEKDPSAMLDQPVNRLYLSVRAQNILTRLGLRTYGDLLKFGREKLLQQRNMGLTTMSVFDAEFDRVGLWNQWKFNRPINV